MKKADLRNHVIITLERFANLLALTGILIVLAASFIFQITLNEIPCPLCLFQRLGFFCMALGFLANLRYGLHPSHYSMVLLSSLLTGIIALRQIALHVVPGTGAYGDAFLGLHLYTWVFILCMLMIGITSFLLGVNRQYKPVHYMSPKWLKITYVMFAITSVLLFINIVSTFLECGFERCSEEPVKYQLLG